MYIKTAIKNEIANSKTFGRPWLKRSVLHYTLHKDGILKGTMAQTAGHFQSILDDMERNGELIVKRISRSGTFFTV